MEELERLSAQRVAEEAEMKEGRGKRPRKGRATEETEWKQQAPPKPKAPRVPRDEWHAVLARIEAMKGEDGSFPELDFETDEELVKWLNSQSRSRALQQLSAEREEALTAAGYDWKQLKKVVPWEENFQKLLQLQQETGSFEIGRSRDPKYDVYFKTWLSNIRQAYKKKKMPKDKMKQLRSIGFLQQVDEAEVCRRCRCCMRRVFSGRPASSDEYVITLEGKRTSADDGRRWKSR